MEIELEHAALGVQPSRCMPRIGTALHEPGRHCVAQYVPRHALINAGKRMAISNAVLTDVTRLSLNSTTC